MNLGATQTSSLPQWVCVNSVLRERDNPVILPRDFVSLGTFFNDLIHVVHLVVFLVAVGKGDVYLF